ncbi:LLM class flavin-dependent oxidoreductase [Ktedonosporobacter rubrisoli]|uniref:LLM class flavin-dependent oxidoreductase n=1 Tax=Ktedonosporobacter rubrisoli TaxID=2509675 RepID=A0A4V0YYY5_KTERU|nr:LLM class flavin-dependent oxidoreductase [Ktedonosporobacter rubrisoli]QBD77841.1 LLM class flavin-dependent oxidoreductase [Ktedonosporobacter rubrisoli]
MHVGVGLPTGVPGAKGQLVIEWARRADEGPFSSLGVVDRLVYDSYEPLTALAAAAAVTRRLKLATTIVIGPLHTTAMLAKMAASLDALSDGRLVLGLAVGARKEDYDAAGIAYRGRGKRFSEQLSMLRSAWEEHTFGPLAARSRGPDLLIGGLSDQGFARVARYADGYVHGGGPPRAFARAADKARAAWRDAGRPGKPQIWAQGYFALGEQAAEAGAAYLKDYYAFTGSFAARIAAGLLTSPQAIAQFIRGYEEAGCDELILFPTVPDLAQLEQLAAVLQMLGRGVTFTDEKGALAGEPS